MARIVVSLLLLLLAGCSSIEVRRTSFPPGKILLLPPRDVVQDGVPHEKGRDSGRLLQEQVMTRIRAPGFSTVATDNPAFGHERVAAREAAIEEARRLGADYALQLVLGEFRDAAPMSFRTDYVVLSQGTMYATATGEEVWVVTSPYELTKTNLGSYTGLLGSLGAAIAESITQ